MKILVLNAGSSSLKYRLFALPDLTELISGLIERIGESSAQHHYHPVQQAEQVVSLAIADHRQALEIVFQCLADTGLLTDKAELFAIGHRVVHGGEHFQQPALINEQILKQIEATIPLAPLHNPANLLGIQVAIAYTPNTPQVAVFDTAFHQTLPDYAYRYPLPKNLYTEHAIRRYGFHGTSHVYVAKLAAKFLDKPLAETNLITLHLGNGASVTAIRNGLSVETSMGMTPLEGLMMGTRSGDIDPAIPVYLSSALQMSTAAIDQLLNKSSGCKGICGENDMRSIQAMAEAGVADAQLALAMYAYRIKKYIGSYFAVLNRVDAIVFTGGIGENASALRAQILADLSLFGLVINNEKNQKPQRPCANIAAGAVPILVIKTDEELEIAMQTLATAG